MNKEDFTVPEMDDITNRLNEMKIMLDADAVVFLAFKRDGTVAGIDCLTDYVFTGLTPHQVAELTIGSLPNVVAQITKAEPNEGLRNKKKVH